MTIYVGDTNNPVYKAYQLPTNEMVSKVLNAPLIAIDIESKDPDLFEKGPGFHRDAYVTGLAVASDPHNKFYLPFNHSDIKPDTPMGKESLAIAEEVLKTKSDKLGANIQYDVEGLESMGMAVNGGLHDVQIAEPLLDEYKRTYALDRLAKGYGLDSKKTYVLENYAAKQGWKGKAIENIWRMPSNVAAEYAIKDVELPLEIFKFQKIKLEQQNLLQIYDMERELIPMYVKMHRQGVRIDEPLLKHTIQYVTERHYQLKEQLTKWAGYEINFTSSFQLAKVLDRKGIPYPRKPPTEKMLRDGKKEGNPNLDKKALMAMKKYDPIVEVLLEYRKYNTTIDLFLAPYLNFIYKGRLHCSFHPLRTDKYGTVSGRYSCSKPNLQQVSSKEADDDEDEGMQAFDGKEVKGKMIRALFIPEEGCKWRRSDYSQVEYRILAHYATGNRDRDAEAAAVALRQMYIDDPTMDRHQMVMDKTGFVRKITKSLNFGAIYGMGIPTAAATFGWTMDESKHFMDTYHKESPYIKTTRSAISSVASQRGYIFTIKGRRARTHPSRKLHSMTNRLIQGSAADIMKEAMRQCWNKGLFETLIPHLTVHDELDVSEPDTKEGLEAVEEMNYTMENAVKLDVPLLVDSKSGKNWSEAD